MSISRRLPTAPGVYQSRIPHKWVTREIFIGKNGELRIVTKDGSDPLVGDDLFSMSRYEWEWRNIPMNDDKQMKIEGLE
ncbi:MAG: hypothetical protein U9Q07_03970 [Planctomycetota bacterium]|nr:hypothetical protein [Planctomycetota bacterium]